MSCSPLTPAGSSASIRTTLGVTAVGDEPSQPNGCAFIQDRIVIYCEARQTGSAWLGSLEVGWYSASVLNRFTLSAPNPTTGEQVAFTITFRGSGAGAMPLDQNSLAVGADRIGGAIWTMEGGKLGDYTPRVGASVEITRAGLTLDFSGKSAGGTITIQTSPGTTPIEITGASSCPDGLKNRDGQQLCTCAN